MLEIKGKYTTAKIMIDDVEEAALNQVYSMVNNLAFTEPIVMQPDIHKGSSSPVGFTMPLTEKIIPNIVSVDISCSVLMVNIGEKLPKQLSEIDDIIHKLIPTGAFIHTKMPRDYFKNNYNWKEANDTLKKFLLKYNEKFNTDYKPIEYTYEWFRNKCKEIGIKQNPELAIGTLGGGNHFISIDKSENDGSYWLTAHTGSRNFGKCICEYHQNKAKELLEDKRKNILNSKINELRKSDIDRNLIPTEVDKFRKELGIDYNTDSKGMEYLENESAIDYYIDMIFTQYYAYLNRHRIVDLIVEGIGVDILDEIDTIHNYIDFEDLIIRKGSVKSYKGQRFAIPLNMRDGILICEGKSNPEWNYSACHGAGRKMSRGDASRNLDMEYYKKTMSGIYSTCVNKNTLDEAPMAYKKSSVIIKNIEPTATILDVVKPVLNIKDGGGRLTYEIKKQLEDFASNEKELARSKKELKKYYKEKKKERRIERNINRELRGKNF